MADKVEHEGAQNTGDSLSRRTAMASVMAAGYAAAVSSAHAEPIHTDSAGLIEEAVVLPNDTPAFLARPVGQGRHPVIIVIHEAFGLHEYIRDVCRRFAKLGYAAIAPAFFARLGDPAPLADLPSVMRIVNGTPDARTLTDLTATVAFLKSRPYADTSRLGVTGFCWGGRWTWLASALIPEVRAAGAWYGFLVPTPINSMLPAPDTQPQLDRLWPSELATQINAPVLGLYAARDAVTQTVPAMREALAAAGKSRSRILIYPDAEHGFHADYRASYHAPSAQDAWRQLIEHFRDNGVR